MISRWELNDIWRVNGENIQFQKCLHRLCVAEIEQIFRLEVEIDWKCDEVEKFPFQQFNLEKFFWFHAEKNFCVSRQLLEELCVIKLKLMYRVSCGSELVDLWII